MSSNATCLHCGGLIFPTSWIPFAWCEHCKIRVQVVWEAANDDDIDRVNAPNFDSYMINLFVDVKTGTCSLLTSEGTCKFPLGKRYDSWALEQMLYAASIDFNTDFVSSDHIASLVRSAVEGIHFQMRALGLRKLKCPRRKSEKRQVSEFAWQYW